MLISLLYASQCRTALAARDIEQILESARIRNLVAGVTGMLCYGNHRFLQFLEGEEDATNSIYDSILKDPRHSDVKLIGLNPAAKRVFGDWSMGFVDMDDMMTKMRVQDITAQDGFHPENLDPPTAMRLIQNLKSTLSDQVIL